MHKETLQRAIELHSEWLQTEGEEGQQAVLQNADLRMVDLEGMDLRYAVLTGANLERATLMRCNFANADLRKANLGYANLSNADLSQANLANARADGTDLTEATLSGACIDQTIFDNAVLRKADLSYCQGKGAQFNHCDLGRADLTGARLDNARFNEANLTNGILKNASLRGADLASALGLWFDQTIIKGDEAVSGSMRPEYESSGLSEDEKRKIRRQRSIRKLQGLLQIMSTVAIAIALFFVLTIVLAALRDLYYLLIADSAQRVTDFDYSSRVAVSALASAIGVGFLLLRIKLDTQHDDDAGSSPVARIQTVQLSNSTKDTFAVHGTATEGRVT